MKFSLKIIFGALVAVVASVVGAACLAVSLITSLDTINAVGEAWARGMGAGVRAVVQNSFVDSEGRALAANAFMNVEAPMLPEDLRDRGINWTTPWVNFLIGQGVRQSYTFTTISVVFNGLPTWIYTAQSRLYLGSQDIEWIETFNRSVPSGVGGLRYWRDNDTLIPWDAKSNNQPEVTYFGVALRLQDTTTWGAVPGVLASNTRLSGKPLAPACMWLAPGHASGLEAVGVHWDAFVACDTKNASGHVVAYALMSIALDAQLVGLLKNSPRSKNGHNFIADTKGYLLATTYPAPFYTSVATTPTAPAGPGCSNSYTVYPEHPPLMGCRFSVSNYAYKPLAAISAATYTTSSVAVETVTSDGSNYIVVASRISTPVGKLQYNVINVVPVDDLLGDVNKGTWMAVGIAAGIIVAAVIAAVSFVFWVLASLDDITTRMEETAQLEGLDQEEVLEDDDGDEDGTDTTADSASSPDNSTVSSHPGSVSNQTVNTESTQYLNLNASAVGTPKSSVGGPGSTNQSAFAAHVNNNNNNNNGNTQQEQKKKSDSGNGEKKVRDDQKVVKHSWIAEVAALEAAYVVTHNNLVNFTRYVPKTVVKELIMRGGINSSTMENANISCSFADIKSFTQLCEKLPAKVLSKTLNLYFSRMTRLVMAHGGLIDRFIGDCIMAVWGAPFKISRHELLASLCALAVQRETAREPLKQRFLDLGFPLSVRVGVASGNVLAGNIGSSDRKAYTVLGEAVQTANSLEPYAKTWGINAIVGEDIARECSDDLVLRLLTRAKLAGRAKPIMCYEVMGVMADAKAKRRGSVTPNEDGGGGDDAGSANSGSTGSGASGYSADTKNSYGSIILPNVDEDGLLPTSVNIEKLLKWHKKRTNCDEKTITYTNMFSEAARHVLDHEFAQALQMLVALENEPTIALHHKQHKSVATLRKIIQTAMLDQGSVTHNANSRAMMDQFFVVA